MEKSCSICHKLTIDPSKLTTITIKYERVTSMDLWSEITLHRYICDVCLEKLEPESATETE